MSGNACRSEWGQYYPQQVGGGRAAFSGSRCGWAGLRRLTPGRLAGATAGAAVERAAAISRRARTCCSCSASDERLCRMVATSLPSSHDGLAPRDRAMASRRAMMKSSSGSGSTHRLRAAGSASPTRLFLVSGPAPSPPPCIIAQCACGTREWGSVERMHVRRAF